MRQMGTAGGGAQTGSQKVAALAFRDDLLAALPALRSYAMLLAGNAARADDLVQEVLLKAWSNQHRFVPGSNLNAWLFCCCPLKTGHGLLG
ncbi:hypothetical protein DK389_09375 [Methylobacterium durans]|uniref:PhyR sigma2 domain-containing protein n=1 Tax=Methylobacterium durans TaxID=2202825 RepID=A0A2U8W3Q1_9HYPH|nr:hypothetical protein DK389_09375 [Methylobacterium durans]